MEMFGYEENTITRGTYRLFSLHCICNQFILITDNLLYSPQAPQTQGDQTSSSRMPFEPTSPSVHDTLTGGTVVHSSWRPGWSQPRLFLSLHAEELISFGQFQFFNLSLDLVFLYKSHRGRKGIVVKQLRTRTLQPAGLGSYPTQFSYLIVVGSLKSY